MPGRGLVLGVVGGIDGSGVAGSSTGDITSVRQEEFTTSQCVFTGPCPRLVVLVEAKLDASITDAIPSDLIGQPQTRRGRAGLASTRR